MGDRGNVLRGHLEDRIRDAQHERRLYEEQIADNARLVGGAHVDVFHPNPDNNYFTANLINHIVVTQTAVMTETAIRPTFVPRETNEPPEIFLRPQSAYKAEGYGLSPGQMAGQEIIPEPLFDFLSSQTVPQKVENPAANEPVKEGQAPPEKFIEVQVPVFNDEDFIFVDDALCAEALTQEITSQWEVSQSDERVRQSIFEAVGMGWKDLLVQWNDENNHFELIPIYPYNGWIDRWCTGTSDAEYYALLQIMPVAEALKEFPEAAAEIEKNKSVNTETNPWGGDRGGKYDRSTEREIVELYTLWERHTPYPLDPEEALASGKVQYAVDRPLVDDETGEVADEGGQPILDERGQPQFITEDGRATAPGDDLWPVRYGIRQLRMIGSHILEEMEAEASDLPVARIRNIPIIESPYGEGEPQRLAELQDLINRLWTIFHDYCMFFRGSEQAMPNSVYDQLGDTVGTLHRTMGRKFGVPDELWQAFNGKIIDAVPPPQLTNTFDAIMRMLLEQINLISGVNDVLRGDAKSEWSGELFAQATNAARGPIGFKARHVSDAIKYAMKIAAGYTIDFLPVEDWAKRNKKYPPQVLEVMRRRLKQVGYDVSVEVGGAGSRESQAQRLTTVVQNNPQLSMSPTFMSQFLEVVGVSDGDKIVREAMQAQQPVQ